jgi:hypothetical protein
MSLYISNIPCSDPHILPFPPHKNYDIMKVGTFSFFASPILEVQILLGKQHNNDKASWNEKIAVRFGKTAYAFANIGGKVVVTLISATKSDEDITVSETATVYINQTN